MTPGLARRATAEALGTGFLVMAVVGSGISAQRLSPDAIGLQLLENTLATVAMLVAVILAFAGISGAHLNPVVTLAERAAGRVGTHDAGAYVAAQVVGACVGTVVANVIYGLPAIDPATTTRSGGRLWVAEVIATLGLLLVINGCVRSGRTAAVPAAVAGWIGAAYWCTSSTSFANPAVTIARSLSDSFAGISPASVPAFVAMQLLGGALAIVVIRFLLIPAPGESS